MSLRTMSRLPFLFLPLIVVCLFSGCCTVPGQGPPCPDLTGTWTLVSYASGNDSMIPVPPEARITAVFGDDSRVSGNAGCNDYFGGYRIEGGLNSPPRKSIASRPKGSWNVSRSISACFRRQHGSMWTATS
jgi:hypothetical protein